jgi:tetratricopeptide (TPR) repeat protein
MSRSLYLRRKGFLALVQGEYAKAVEILLSEETGAGCNFATHYHLGRAYLGLDSFDEAIRVFEKILNRYDEERAEMIFSSVKSQYLLGVAYEGAGRKEEAIKQYETFLTIWKDADPHLVELGEARERLRDLKENAP